MAVQLKRTPAASALSIMPLIDVVFLLLIFFMIATEFAVESRELDVELPDASQAEPLTKEIQTVIVNIDKDGRYYIEGNYRQLESVRDIMEQKITNNPLIQTAVIRGDKSSPLQAFVSLSNLCKEIGMAHVLEIDAEN